MILSFCNLLFNFSYSSFLNTSHGIIPHISQANISKGTAFCLVIRLYKVRIVAVGTDIYNLVRSDSHQFGAGRYSAPYHTQTDIYLANLRIFIGISEEYISFLTLFTDIAPKIQSYGTCLLPHIACNAVNRFHRRV